jgi:hypothetical protein
MKHGRASSRTFWPSLGRNNGDIDQNLQKTDLSSRRGGCTSGLDLTSAATMQHPWLISRPDMPGYVHASGFVEASWPQRLDGDGPARSHRRAATECYGRGGKVHDDGSALRWMGVGCVRPRVYPQYIVEMDGEVRSRSERWTTVLRECQDHVARANAFPLVLRPVRWLM